MNNEDSNRIFLEDPLSESAKKRRRNLLIISGIGIFIYLTGQVPTEIKTFGIEFDTKDQELIVSTFIIVNIYLLVTYCISLTSDYITWYIKYHKQLAQEKLDKQQKNILETYGIETSLQRFLPLYNTGLSIASREEAEKANKDIVDKTANWFIKRIGLYGWFAKPIVALRIIIDVAIPVITSLLSVFFVLRLVPSLN